MNEPRRLRDSAGPSRVLMGGSKLEVPSAARRRALAFTGAAAGMAVSGTAAAASAASVIKSVVLCVCLGTVGGGVVSLAVSETVARIDSTQVVAAKPSPAPQRTAPLPPVVAAAPAEPAPVADEPAAPPETTANGRPATVTTSSASSVVAGASSVKPRLSLFEEQRLVESARAAVARGDAASALTTLNDYERTYARGQFGPEVLALRIEALSSQGDFVRARSLAARFKQKYPHHPLLSRVQAAVQR